MKIYNEKLSYEIAKNRVIKLKKFYANAIVFLVVLFLFYGIKFLKFDTEYSSKIQINLVFVIWGLILMIQAIKLFLFGTNWETKKMNQLTNKYNNQ